MSDELTTVREFPPEVHESLKELRRIARYAKSRSDPGLRWATADEIALAETQRTPNQCVATSTRTGLPCALKRLRGCTVCRKHGGAVSHVKDAAEQRLRELTMPVLARQYDLAMQSKHLPTAFNASADLLDRANVGALVQAKVRQSRNKDSGSRVTVNIGFLTAGHETPQVISASSSSDTFDQSDE